MLLAAVLDDIGRRLTGRLVLQLQVKFVIGSRVAMCASPAMQVSYNIIYYVPATVDLYIAPSLEIKYISLMYSESGIETLSFHHT